MQNANGHGGNKVKKNIIVLIVVFILYVSGYLLARVSNFIILQKVPNVTSSLPFPPDKFQISLLCIPPDPLHKILLVFYGPLIELEIETRNSQERRKCEEEEKAWLKKYIQELNKKNPAGKVALTNEINHIEVEGWNK